MRQIDKRNRFDEDVFAYRTAKNGAVFITWHGKQATILRGKEAEKFLKKLEGLERREAQLVMAKVTGNFKRGNER